ncbi:MAG: hypothetical protein JWO42_3182 [Chloroflexi bacterium]|nr:hypothetical protein [Chloroflexota bacterium]
MRLSAHRRPQLLPSHGTSTGGCNGRETAWNGPRQGPPTKSEFFRLLIVIEVYFSQLELSVMLMSIFIHAVAVHMSQKPHASGTLRKWDMRQAAISC